MPTHRYPVLVLRDPAGGFTAVAVDEQDLAGFGATAAAARDDLKGFLEWAHRKRADVQVPDFRDPELHTFKVTVRPEYKTRQRIYPSDQPVAVRVAVRHRHPGQRPAARVPAAARAAVHLSRGGEPQEPRPAVRPAETRRADPEELAAQLALPRSSWPKSSSGCRGRRSPRPGHATPVHPGPGRRAARRPGRPQGVRPRLGPRGRGRRAGPQAAPREGERAARRRAGVGKTTLMVDAVKEAENSPGRRSRRKRRTAPADTAAVLAHVRRAAHRRDEVPRPVGGAGRGGHRGTGRDRGRAVRGPVARPGPHRRASADRQHRRVPACRTSRAANCGWSPRRRPPNSTPAAG